MNGVEKDEQRSIILSLIDDKTVKESLLGFIFSDGFLIHISDPFFDFYDKVKLELAKIDKPNIIKSISDNTLSFDSEKSILHFSGYKIIIAKRNEKPIAHYILEHIFTAEDGLSQQYSYWEIAEETFKDTYEKWQKYYRACEDVNEKVLDVTGINDFLDYSTGRKGNVKINKKYLK